MDDLIAERAELELAYTAANDEVAEAKDNAKVAKAAVIEFDEQHPEVMQNAKAEANQRKFDAGEAARAEREAEAEEGAE